MFDQSDKRALSEEILQLLQDTYEKVGGLEDRMSALEKENRVINKKLNGLVYLAFPNGNLKQHKKEHDVRSLWKRIFNIY